jgi:hypothetical protein
MGKASSETLNTDKALREQLVKLLTKDEAHAGFEKAVKGMPLALAGKKPEGAPHSVWEELEHIRIALWDILEFSLAAEHASPEWPKEYWPAEAAPKDQTAWRASVATVREDMKRLVALVQDPKTDLFAKIPHGQGQTILREVLLVADHNAYHVGQLILVRKILGAWD